MDIDHRKIALGIARARDQRSRHARRSRPCREALLGKAAGNPAVRAVLRLVGIRDLVLGIGAITTLKERTMDAEWVGVGAVSPTRSTPS